MRSYTFYYCLASDCFGKSPAEMYVVSASTYFIASSRFFDFYQTLTSDYINFFRYYSVDSPNGKTSLRSMKNSDVIFLSEITAAHNNKEL